MLLKFKPTTPGLRGTVLVSKKELSKEKPHKSLTKKFKSKEDQKMIKVLLGDEVAPRKDFITNNALDVANLDI